MAVVSDLFVERWRSGEHVGDAAPTGRVWVRTGHYIRDYLPWSPRIDATIPRESSSRPWRMDWVPDSDWVELPTKQSITLEQDFSQQGVTVATIVAPNVVLTEQTGSLGAIYHLIERGYLAPLRGYRAPQRPKTGVPENEWFQKLNRNAQVYVEQGYGDEMTGTFVGLIDDIDLDSNPAQVTITARDHAQVLTDQQLFGRNKSPQLTQPVTFADKYANENVEYVGHGAKASSSDAGHDPRWVLDKNSHSSWRSIERASEDDLEWVEIRLPKGRYSSFYIVPTCGGTEVFIGMFIRKRDAHHSARVDDVPVDEGWYDPNGTDTPGATNGGWPYFRHLANVSRDGHHVNLKHEFIVGDDTVLRVGFRKLCKVPRDSRYFTPTYRVGVKRLQGKRRTIKQIAVKNRWILCGDVSDIVRVVLRWAGFEEWAVEDTGIKIKGTYTVNQSKYLMDIITDVCQQTGFVFFMKEPTNMESLGKPVFRRNQALTTKPVVAEVRDTDLLTGVQVKMTDEPLSSSITIRGKLAKKSQGGRALGNEFGNERHIMGRYTPPWAKRLTPEDRLAGVLKYVVADRPDLKSQDTCLYGCMQIALYEVLEAVTAVVEIPGNPAFELDEHASLIDTNTGLNTRLWISQRRSEQTFGSDASWKVSMTGALLDSPDITAIKRDVHDLFRRIADEAAYDDVPVALGGHAQPPSPRPPLAVGGHQQP